MIMTTRPNERLRGLQREIPRYPYVGPARIPKSLYIFAEFTSLSDSDQLATAMLQQNVELRCFIVLFLKICICIFLSTRAHCIGWYRSIDCPSIDVISGLISTCRSNIQVSI